MPLLLFENLSSNPTVACVFQTYATAPAGAMPTAWQARRTLPNAFWKTFWNESYSFVWSQTQTKPDGSFVTTGQIVAADPAGKNTATLTYADRSYSIVNVRTGGVAGTIMLEQDGLVPALLASAGIGMANAPACTVPVQPNLPLKFGTAPRYWITVGNYTSGTPLDPARALPQKELVYANNVEALYVSLQPDNTLSSPLPIDPNALTARFRDFMTFPI